MIECDVRAVVYVGLLKNVSKDLGGRRRLFRRAATNVGAAGESFYLWYLVRPVNRAERVAKTALEGPRNPAYIQELRNKTTQIVASLAPGRIRVPSR